MRESPNWDACWPPAISTSICFLRIWHLRKSSENTHRNTPNSAFIFWLRRNVDLLTREGRPLSLGADLRAMYAEREPLYRRFADHIIDNNGPVADTVARILEVLQ